MNFDEQVAHWAMSLGWPQEALLRLVLAAVAGGLIGLEREVRGRQAGFRTNLLVCMGSCLAMLVSIHFAKLDWPHDPKQFNITIDPARVSYGIMAGIGFLGAGAIVKSGTNVRGLTTAAGIWCVAALGLAAGLGMYMVSAMAAMLVIMALWILSLVEDNLPRRRHRKLTVRRKWGPDCVTDIVRWLHEQGMDVRDTEFRRVGENHEHVDIDLRVSYMKTEQLVKLERTIEHDALYDLIAVTKE